MSFLGIYRAIYDYAPQIDEELALKEGDLLYVLEKSSEDAWWKAKKKAAANEDEEPVGLIPNTYVEESVPVGKLRALYDYQRQTDEELSFSEDAILDVYDNSDPDWSLVGLKGEYGFAPANYLEKTDDAPIPAVSSPIEAAPPPLPSRNSVTLPPRQPEPEPEPESEPEESPVRPSPATTIAAALKQRQASIAAQSPVASPTTARYTPPPQMHTQKAVHFTPEASDDDEPAPRLPERPRSDISTPYASPISPNPPTTFEQMEAAGVHRYPLDEIVNKKKVPCVLELGNGRIILTPQKKSIPSTTWEIEDLQTYSADGKHVGLDLVSPIRSLDLRAENKETASEIIRDLGEMRGAARAAGLSEVMAIAKSGGKKLGIILYDFDAQGSDEVSVKVGDEVVILDDGQSDEWWNVRRIINGKEGVVPSSYVEIKNTRSIEAPATEESSKGKERDSRYSHQHKASVGPGIMLPPRDSSLNTPNTTSTTSSRKPTGRTATSDKPKPNAKHVRTWTDRSGTFKVDAEFLNLRDGVIHLHKVNGVKIAVPVAKMSKQDLEYVERKTGLSLDEDKPLSDLRGKHKASVTTAISAGPSTSSAPKSPIGITVDRSKGSGNTSVNDYDWFEFFLNCGVDVHACQRYANNFAKDSMDESILPEINQAVLRTLGLKEGDILRVMKFLDNKYGRKKEEVTGNGDGQQSLFTNPDGGLKNNTRRERPAPGVQTSDVVDPKMLEQRKPTPEPSKMQENSAKDNDPWVPKPSKQESEPPKSASPAPQQVTAAPAETQAQPKPQPPTGALRELSLLDEPLRPTVVAPAPSAEQSAPVLSPPAQPSSAPPQQTWQPPPANILAAPLSVYQQPAQQTSPTSPPYINYQQTGVLQPQHTAFQTQPLQAQATARQRPQAPQIAQNLGGLVPPPPQRPQSTPAQNFPQQIQPLVPAITGYQNVSSVAPQGQLSMQQQLQQAEFQRQLQAQQALQQQQALLQQQQAAALQPQLTAVPNNFGIPQINYGGIAVQPTGYGQPQLGFNNTLLPQPTGSALGPLPPPFKPTVDLSLPTPLLPQNTAVQQQQNGFGNQFGAGNINKNLMPALAPLKPQATGPAPAVKFGVTPSKLAPQPTGVRKANLNAATPENPFGF
ncbi:cytoskeletal protein binding protein [Orbilia oligospora]|uniref:Actin cytoskeleton-regulatory complex protein SLA1 n=1 Tax=Orbilia oligospora TaxID=2813651 RepID=A0A7C8RHQ2_ORBOL|nr:cytoskeletal protein binding protein [Orbilia oligospora]